MKIKFLGAVGKVTGSCTWCIHPRTGTQFLVDCGAVQGMHQEAENNMPFPFEPNRLKFVLLTHAHMDHCGRIPQLYAQGFRGKIICTSATAQLALLQLQDSHSNAENRLQHSVGGGKKKGRQHGPRKATPPYPCPDWFYPIDRNKGFAFQTPRPIDEDLFVSFQRSSHILGGCSISIMWSRNFRKSICFSGDIGPNSNGNCYQSLMKKNQVPHWNSSYIVVEATYGGKDPRTDNHKNFKERMHALEKVVNSGCDTVVFPCFAMQRTQEVLVDVWNMLRMRGNEQSREWGIVLDSSLAIKACHLFRKELGRKKLGKDDEHMYLNEELEQHMGKENACTAVNDVLKGSLEWISFKKDQQNENNGEDSTLRPNGENRGPSQEAPGSECAPEAVGQEKKIIITSSGMCHAGPVLGHLNLLEHTGTVFVITGFQGTFNGKQLQSVAQKQEDGDWDRENGEDVFLHTDEHEENGRQIRIRGRVFNLAPYYSGHADINGLLDYILEFGEKFKASPPKIPPPPATVFLNHGDNPSRDILRRKILAMAYAPDAGNIRKISNVEIPRMDSPFFDLDRGEWEVPPGPMEQLAEALAQWRRQS